MNWSTVQSNVRVFTCLGPLGCNWVSAPLLKTCPIFGGLSLGFWKFKAEEKLNSILAGHLLLATREF